MGNKQAMDLRKMPHTCRYLFTKTIFIDFKKRKRERGKDRLVASRMPPTRDRTYNPGMCLELNWGPLSAWGDVQPIEPHWRGLQIPF